MAPALYLNEIDLTTYLLRNGPSLWLCKFTLFSLLLNSVLVLMHYSGSTATFIGGDLTFSCQLLDGLMEARMTFH